VFVTSHKRVNHRGQDVIVPVGAQQQLVGKFAYGTVDKDLKDEAVEVFIQDDPPYGEWLSLGTEMTSRDGEHGTRFGVKDDGGRIFFAVPDDKVRSVGRHPVRMLVKGDHSFAAFSLFVIEPGTSAVVFDIDGTLTTGDREVAREYLNDLLSREYVPHVRAGAVKVARAYADKGYFIVYLTGRPDNLRQISEEWLIDKGFPPGAIHCTDHIREALPKSERVGRFKTEFIQVLQERGLSIFAAYGNAPTDIEAYEAATIPKERTFIVGEHAGKSDTVALDSYTSHLEDAERMPEAGIIFPMPKAWW